MQLNIEKNPKEPTQKKVKKTALWGLLIFVFLGGTGIAFHEFSIRYFQDVACVTCHEMKDPVRRWRESGVAKNHNNCAACHFDAGIKGWVDMNVQAVRLFFIHFERDPNEPLRPLPEPLIIDVDKEPGYWSHVPNSRCFKCKEAKNHHPRDQAEIHRKLLKDVASQPCKDCHNHEMRKGQKFYEKILKDEKLQTQASSENG